MNKYGKILGFIGITVLFIFFSFSIFASAVFAQGLVPCGNPGQSACTVCDFFVLIDNLIDFVAIKLVPPLALLLIVIGAVFLIISSGSQELYNKGKNIITMAILGALIIWSSWMIIDVVMGAIAGGGGLKSLKTWNTIECVK